MSGVVCKTRIAIAMYRSWLDGRGVSVPVRGGVLPPCELAGRAAVPSAMLAVARHMARWFIRERSACGMKGRSSQHDASLGIDPCRGTGANACIMLASLRKCNGGDRSRR